MTEMLGKYSSLVLCFLQLFTSKTVYNFFIKDILDLIMQYTDDTAI